MTAAETCASLASDCVYLINEDDGRCLFLSLLEQVADSRRTNADEHLNEVRTAYREKRSANFAGNRLCKQSLTCSGRANEQNALRNSRAYLAVLAGVLQEVDDLLKLLLFLVCACNVVKCDLLAGVLAHVRLGEAGHLSSTGALAHYYDRKNDHHADQQQVREYVCQERIIGYRDIILDKRAVRVRLVVSQAVVCRFSVGSVSGVDIVDENADIRHGVLMSRSACSLALELIAQRAASEIELILCNVQVVELRDNAGICDRSARGIARNVKYRHQSENQKEDNYQINNYTF